MVDRFLFSKHVEEDEKVVRIVHAHWLIGIKELLLPTVSFSLSIMVLSSGPATILLYVVSLWSIGSIVWWLRNFCDYYLDVWIVTDHGIVSLEWLGWFHRQSTRILYSDVQGISYDIHGLVGTLMRFGTLTVEKISTGATVSLEHVAHPRSIASVMLKQMEAYVHSKNLKNAKHVQELLSELIAGEVHARSARGASPAEPPSRP